MKPVGAVTRCRRFSGPTARFDFSNTLHLTLSYTLYLMLPYTLPYLIPYLIPYTLPYLIPYLIPYILSIEPWDAGPRPLSGKHSTGDPRCGSSPPCIPVQLGLAYTQHWPKSCTHELEDGRGKHGQPHSIHAPRDFNNPFRVLTLTLTIKRVIRR